MPVLIREFERFQDNGVFQFLLFIGYSVCGQVGLRNEQKFPPRPHPLHIPVCPQLCNVLYCDR
jgi:hypothetical protein